jgi:aminoglycoside phosphotransferase (APT) family kinase protein
MPQPIEREAWWQERVAFLRSRPPSDGLRRMTRTVAPGATVGGVRRLGGGLATATSAVRLRTRSGRGFDVVLKRFPRVDDPYAIREWKRIRFAQRLPVPSPEPIALDLDGEWFGVPALVMTKLPGRPDVVAKDIDRWLEEFARVQAAIHSAPIRRPPAYLRHARELVGQPVSGLPSSPTFDEAIGYVSRRFSRARTRDLVIGHGDAHPGNVLWSRGRISGVTDWHHVGLMPRGHEVAYARADIAVLVGPQAADDYLEAYERMADVRVRDLPMWDLRQGLGAIRWCPLWALAYREQGADLTATTARRRATAFVKRVLGSVERGDC